MNRIKLLLFVVTILILSVSIFSSVFFENVSLLKMWNIPVCPPSFLDSRQIAIAAESYAKGYDPLDKNLLGQKGYYGLNYPRIWHILFAFGINQSHTNLIGSIIVILFFTGIGIFWFSNKFTNLTYLILPIIIISPVVMLGIERGNIELVILFVLSVALFINYYSNISAVSLFLFASILKLYPVFSFVYLLRENKKRFCILFGLAFVIFTTYMLFTLDDFKQIYLLHPKNAKSSFGLNVFWMGLTHPRILNLQLSADVIMIFKILSYIALMLILLGALIFSIKNYNKNISKQANHLDAFRVGASIYIGCFLLGNNYDYRLIFLIFTIPQLVIWLNTEQDKISKIPLVTLSAIIFSCWSYVLERIIGIKLTFVLEELSNWIVLSGLLYLFLVSLPDWFMDYLRRPFSLISRFNKYATGITGNSGKVDLN